MILFSVVIPVYNSEEYLNECVQSVLDQDYKSFEIILVNDYSNEKTSEIIKLLSNQNNQIKVIHHNTNFGVSVSRNTGINAASGEYVIFLDSDDCLILGCLADIAQLINENPKTQAIIARYICQRYTRRGENSLSQDFTFDNSAITADDPDGTIAHLNHLSPFSFYCWRYVISRHFINKNDLYFIPHIPIWEDIDYVARLLCLIHHFSFYNKCMYLYRARPGSLTSSIVRYDYNLSAICLEIANELCKIINNHKLSYLKYQFVSSEIKAMVKRFFVHLSYNKQDCLPQLARFIDRNIDGLKVSNNIFEDIDIYRYAAKHGAYNLLLNRKEYIANSTITLIKDIGKRKLYIFCADLYGGATATIFQSNGYAVTGFLDNDQTLEGKMVVNINIYSPSFLSHMSTTELADIFVVVCHQRKSAYESISTQLHEVGLELEQVVHKTF